MKAVHRLWLFALSSPIIYLLICAAIDQWVFAKRTASGFWPMSEGTYRTVFGILAALAIAAMPLAFFLKARWVTAAPDLSDEEEITLFDNPRGRRFTVLFMICDGVAVLGLILFLIQGRLNAMLTFGVLGLVCYAIAYPGVPPPESDNGRHG